MEEELKNSEEQEQQPIYGDYASVMLGMVVIKVDDVKITLPLPVTHEQIVSALIGAKGETETYAAARFELLADKVASVTLGEEFDELAYAKAAKTIDVTEYDASSAVNEFTYQGVAMWLDKDTRNGLLMRFNAEQLAGKEASTLWYGSQSFTIAPADGIAMVNTLEVYASACYDKTAEHKAAIAALTTVKKVEAYDFTTGYPEKLAF